MRVLKSQQMATHTPEAIQDVIVDLLTKRLQLETKAISPDRALTEYGIDSVMTMELLQVLENFLERSLDVTIIWRFPTPALLAKHLAFH